MNVTASALPTSFEKRAALAAGTGDREILTTLARDTNIKVRQLVADNPGTPTKTLTQLSRDRYASVRAAVARHRSSTPATLTRLARDSDAPVRLAAYQNPATPPSVLSRAAANPFLAPDVLAALAANPSTPANILTQLAHTGGRVVLLHLAYNPSTPSDALEHIACHHPDDLRIADATRRELCRRAAAGLTGDQHAAAAELLPTWPGTATQLLTTVAEILSSPDQRDLN